MSATITANGGAGSTAPLLVVVPLEHQREPRTQLHDLIGGGIDVTHRPPRPRAGEFRLLYADEASAAAAADLHARAQVFTLTWPERPTFQMQYVVPDSGGIRVTFDEATRIKWTVTIGWQEVTP